MVHCNLKKASKGNKPLLVYENNQSESEDELEVVEL